jgi:adenylosuccinate synthase
VSVCAVIGGQFGSEGKGLIVGHLADQYNHHVRVGAANAGHTVYDIDGHKRVMQQIPCAAYTNPFAGLWIGPGALISSSIFFRELEALQAWRELQGFQPAVINVDARAHLITAQQIDREALSGLDERIGSTSTIAREGIGTAQADRVMRSESCRTADVLDGPALEDIRLRDVPMALRGQDSILLEGTQGTGLSLTTGGFPFVTSRNTTVAGLAADCGIAPSRINRRIMVIRTFPIRVAGPSGPFWHDSKEIEWEDIGIDPESERTTVTKKVRRVATFSHAQLEEAVALNDPTELALTFCDYICPEIAGATEFEGESDAVEALLGMIEEIEHTADRPVTMLGTGPKTVLERDA